MPLPSVLLTAAEFLAGGAIIWAVFHEEKVARWERRVLRRFRGWLARRATARQRSVRMERGAHRVHLRRDERDCA